MDAEAYKNKGNKYANREKYPQALEYYEKALTVDPDYLMQYLI
jgi:tetratricopeptide (TPR) repeat protein